MRRVLAVALVIGGIAGLADAGVASAPAKVTRAEIRKLREAAQRTIDAGPRAYEVEVDLTIPEDPPSPDRTIQPFRARGVIDPATGRIRFFATYLQLAFRGEGPELDVIGQFYDYGTPLDASPPPAEQVVAFDAVADQLEPFLGPVDG